MTAQHAPTSPDPMLTIAAILVETIKSERGIHAETAIVSAGALTGEFVLRASGFDYSGLEPGTAVFSDVVNQLMFEAEDQLTVSDVFMNALFAQGIEVGKESWPDDIPEMHQVVLDPLQVVARARPRIDELFEHHTNNGTPLTMLERAYLAAQATAYMVAQARRALDANIGKTLALEAILRGAKSVPYRS